MEDWLKDAKVHAKIMAEDILRNLRDEAESIDIDEDWFINETVKELRKLCKDTLFE